MEDYSPDFFSTDTSEQTEKKTYKVTLLWIAVIFLCLIVFIVRLGISVHQLKNPASPQNLTDAQASELNEFISANYPDSIVKKLP